MTEWSTLRVQIGTEIGVSDWMVVGQSMVDQFADLTGDHLWIHVDETRAAAGPFGARIVHGFLLLSLLPTLGGQEFLKDPAIGSALNYGLDRVRFVTPVRCGSRVRNRIKLLALEERGTGHTLLTIENTMDVESEPKPAMVAISLVMALAA